MVQERHTHTHLYIYMQFNVESMYYMLAVCALYIEIRKIYIFVYIDTNKANGVKC